MADAFGAERPVDPPVEDAAHFLVFQLVRGGEPFGDQGLDESKGLQAIHLEIEGKLRPLMTLAVEASHSDPFGFSSRPTQRFQCVLASLEMLNHR